MASPATNPIQFWSVALSDDQLIYLGAMSLYAAGLPNAVHHEKIAHMNYAVHDAKLMWAVLRANRQQPNDGDVPDAHAPTTP